MLSFFLMILLVHIEVIVHKLLFHLKNPISSNNFESQILGGNCSLIVGIAGCLEDRKSVV